MDEKVVETKKDDDAVVSSNELQQIEKSLLDKDKEKEAALRKEVEEKVRKEMEDAARLRELEAEKAKLEAAVKKQAEDKATFEQQKSDEIEELKKKIGSTKHVIDTQSPFGGAETPGNNQFTNKLTPEVIRDIDEESKEAFFKKQGLNSDWSK